jgi:NtrC-family two-component system response regulator AlgB
VRVLIVDDEKNIRATLTTALKLMEHEVTAVANSASALHELKLAIFDVVLLDLRLSQESGLDVLEEILRLSPRAAVILVTAYATVETAVEAMRRGAFDYLPKPCTPQQLRQVLERVERTRKLESRVVELEFRHG